MKPEPPVTRTVVDEGVAIGDIDYDIERRIIRLILNYLIEDC